MRTKHILTALAVPMVFAACTDEQFENNQSPALAKRPMVGQVTFVEDGANTRLADPTTGAMTFKDGDKFGMVLMDEASGSSGNANIGSTSPRFYNLANKAYTNYPFTKSGDTWKSEAQLMEGNYFYYMPYTDNQSDDSKTKVTRNGGLEWVISPVQNAFTVDAPTVLAPYNAVAENQLYVGYEALDADAPVTTLTNKMIAVHATMGFKIVNNDASSINVKRVVLEYSDATTFKNKGVLNVQTGKAKAATDIYTIMVDGRETAKSLTASHTLADVYKLYNADVKGNRNDFTKNPLMLDNGSSNLFVNGTGSASSIALNFPVGGYTLASGASVFAQMVVPANMTQTNLCVRIYTDKGVTLLPIKTDNYTTNVAGTGDVVFTGGITAGSESATVALKMRNSNKQAEYKDVASVFGTTDVLPNAWNVATVGVKVAAIQIPTKMNIYSTDDLDAFLGYCTLNPNVGEMGAAIEAKIMAKDVDLSKEAYAVLKGNAKIQLTVDSSVQPINIPNTVTDTDVLTRIIWAAGSKAIVNGNQTIAVDNWDSATAVNLNNLTITNTAELTISNFTGASNTAKLTTLGNLYNQGTVVVRSPLTATTIVNGFINRLSSAAYNTVNTNAVISTEANVTATNVDNIGTINVNGNVTLTAAALNGKFTAADKADKVGKVVVAAGKELKTEGTFDNEGLITLNGALLAKAALTNNGTIENNFGLDVMTGVNLDNDGKIVVSKDARYTSVTTNTGTVEILARDTEIEVKDGTAGEVVYTAVDDDYVSGEFTLLPTDRFNTLALNRGATIKPAVDVAVGGTETLKTGMNVVMAALTLKLNVGEKFRFHSLFETAGVVIAKNKYVEIASNLTVTKSVKINSGATLQNNTSCTFTYGGLTADFVNGGTFRNLGTFGSTTSREPAGNFTGSGLYSWSGSLIAMVVDPAGGTAYDVAGTVTLAETSGTGAIVLNGAGKVIIPAAVFSAISGRTITVNSARVEVVIGSEGSGDQLGSTTPTSTDINTQIPYSAAAAGAKVTVYWTNSGSIDKTVLTKGASSWI